jgi:hypothetical protein
MVALRGFWRWASTPVFSPRWVFAVIVAAVL